VLGDLLKIKVDIGEIDMPIVDVPLMVKEG
jgi:hypothetical protein